MSRMSVFISPFLLGFEQFERTTTEFQLSSDSYPPYNIEQLSANLQNHNSCSWFEKGFEISLEGNQLQLRLDPMMTRKIYIHRGIATRQFQKNFILAEGLR